jgi:hypothetical protein
MKKRKSVRKGAAGEPSAFFSLFFGDIVIQGIDAPKCL